MKIGILGFVGSNKMERESSKKENECGDVSRGGGKTEAIFARKKEASRHLFLKN